MPAIPAFAEDKKCKTTIGPSVCHPSWCPVISYKPHVDACVVSWHLVTVFSVFEDAVCMYGATTRVLSFWITLALLCLPCCASLHAYICFSVDYGGFFLFFVFLCSLLLLCILYCVWTFCFCLQFASFFILFFYLWWFYDVLLVCFV